MENSNISGNTRILGIIGDPIDHVLSPIMQNSLLNASKLNWKYIPFQVKQKDLQEAVKGLRALNVKGFNVTIPHKVSIIPFLDDIEGHAITIQAVNTVKNENGKLVGRNTDAMGALNAILDAKIEINKKNVVIFGAGGAARAILFALAPIVNHITIINRTRTRMDLVEKAFRNNSWSHINSNLLENNKNTKESINSADLLINTTSVGMNPNIDQSIIPKGYLHSNCAVFDMVYTPFNTKLLQYAKEVGCQTISGVDMLVNQGAAAFEWWTNSPANKELMQNILKKYLSR